jgi:serine/threonine-protein kinase RsbW
MPLWLAMRLPLQAASVTAARHSLERALAGIGVAQDCQDDLALALTEACSNAVGHALVGHVFDVDVTVDRIRCIVDVADTGVGMDVARLDGHPVALTAKRGRGLRLIRAVIDRLEMRRVDPHGLALRMTKSLTWSHGAPARWAGIGRDPWGHRPT